MSKIFISFFFSTEKKSQLKKKKTKFCFHNRRIFNWSISFNRLMSSSKTFLLLIFLFFFTNIYAFKFNFTKLFTPQQIKKIKEIEKFKISKTSFNNIPEFPCKPLKPNKNPPEDASKLKFSDIKVMMALGDSMTAGFGMVRKKKKKILNSFQKKDERFVDWVYEYRGYSGLIGADEGAPTMFNYFKKIGNPIKGGSVKHSLIWNRE